VVRQFFVSLLRLSMEGGKYLVREGSIDCSGKTTMVLFTIVDYYASDIMWIVILPAEPSFRRSF